MEIRVHSIILKKVIFLLPPGWNASPSQVYSHLGGESHYKSKVCCPRTQHIVPGQGSSAGVKRTKHEAPRLPLYHFKGLLNLLPTCKHQIELENNPKQIRMLIGLKPCFYLTIRLLARDFYEVIVDEAEGRINYRLIEIESE